jgi:hypothetical protein
MDLKAFRVDFKLYMIFMHPAPTCTADVCFQADYRAADASAALQYTIQPHTCVQAIRCFKKLNKRGAVLCCGRW